MKQIDKVLQTVSSSLRQQTSLTPLQQKGEVVRRRFGTDRDFMLKVNPDTQVDFGSKPRNAVMGDYPTLNDIEAAYGKGIAVEWLVPQLASVALFSGARNMTQEQLHGVARIMAENARHLKVTELLLFFFRFKSGNYGHFYGSVDPMVITKAFKEFMSERGEMIERYEQEDRIRKEEEYKAEHPPITYEEYLKTKSSTK